MKRLLIVFFVLAFVGAACSSDPESESDTNDGNPTESTTTDGGQNGDGQNGDGQDGDGQDGDGQDPNDGTGPDNDDFGDIVGNPDLDVDNLPGTVGSLVDDIDDIVSLGDCVAAGLMATAPEGWMCRVLDNPTPTFDGFTMFTEGNDLNITIGTPSGLGPTCELLQACDDVVPIALSDNFPDTMLLELFGTITIYGTHASGAELVITKASALTDEETQLVMDVLDSVEPA